MPPTTPAPAARAKLARLAMGANGSDTIDQAYAFSSVSPGAREETIDIGTGLGGYGTLAHQVANVRQNSRFCQPRMSFRPSVGELANLLPWIMLGTPSGSGTITYPLGTALAARKILWDDTQEVFELNGVCCSRAAWSASSGAELTLDVDGEGTDYAIGATFPIGLVMPAGPRLLFRDLAVTVGGTAVKTRSVRVEVSHGVNNDRRFFGAVSSGPANMDRVVTVSLDMPYGVHKALWDAGSAAAGVAVVVPFAYGGYSLTFTMPAVRTPTVAPDARVPDEIFLPWNGQAFTSLDVSDNVVPELTTVLDTTA